ncbi:ATP-grasp domain-containing protein [Reichenbachiella sp.]|uniref:ATP-grasp domain-containing protein n=1 Tax=Reichenbachiella sp. TaxID=2184521 RepID=UPI003B5CE415
MALYDIVLLTDSRFTVDNPPDQYADNVVLEDRLLFDAFKQKELKVFKTNWDNPDFDWTSTKCAIIRTTWDIYDDGKFEQFQAWLDRVKDQTHLINDYDTIQWNVDKHYLKDLEARGIKIPPTVFIPQGDSRSLEEIAQSSGWTNPILKPAISGGGRHTYKLTDEKLKEVSDTFSELIQNEAMLLQEFQHNVVEKGELTLMVFDGKYSHAVLKKAKAGDFRVQDDFGGTVHAYEPSPEEIAFAEHVVSVCDPIPLQARVDFIWDNEGDLCVSELELIEPELWFRNKKGSAEACVEGVVKRWF